MAPEPFTALTNIYADTGSEAMALSPRSTSLTIDAFKDHEHFQMPQNSMAIDVATGVDIHKTELGLSNDAETQTGAIELMSSGFTSNTNDNLSTDLSFSYENGVAVVSAGATNYRSDAAVLGPDGNAVIVDFYPEKSLDPNILLQDLSDDSSDDLMAPDLINVPEIDQLIASRMDFVQDSSSEIGSDSLSPLDSYFGEVPDALWL